MHFFKQFSLKEIIIITFTFLAIIYSTSFHYAGSPPNDTFEPGQFFVETTAEDGGDPIIDKYFTDHGLFYTKFFKDGKWPDEFHPRNMTGWNDMWKSSAMSYDIAYYILYAGYYGGLIEEIEPAKNASSVLKYRVLVPMIVGNISKISKLSKNSDYKWSDKYISRIVYIYLILNFFCILITAFLFLFFLINAFSFSKNLSIFGAILFITLPIVTKSGGFPQTEPISLLITLLLFMSVFYKKVIYFLLLSFLGLLVKDLFVYASVLWFFNFQFLKEKNIKKYINHFIISALPLVFFVCIRLYYSDGAGIESRGSYDILKGEMPPWLMGSSLYYYLEKYFLVFTFLWVGIVNMNKNIFLRNSLITLLFLTLISLWIARGSGIVRHVGLLFPIIIPMFLFFFHKQKNKLKV